MMAVMATIAFVFRAEFFAILIVISLSVALHNLILKKCHWPGMA